MPTMPRPHTMTAPPSPTTAGDGVLLADALGVNALTSCGTGLVLAAGAPWLASPLGAPTWLLAAIGVGLVVFAIDIVVALARPAGLRRAAGWIIAADVAWVLGAAVVIATELLTALGSVLLGAVSAAVAGFAIAQVVGLRRAGHVDGCGPVTQRSTIGR